MTSYSAGSKKANAVVHAAVLHAIEQVQKTSLSPQDQIEYAYLIVREKLDRMEMSGEYDHQSVGVSDSEVCEAVINQLSKKLNVPDASLMKDYPEALPELRDHALTLAD